MLVRTFFFISKSKTYDWYDIHTKINSFFSVSGNKKVYQKINYKSIKKIKDSTCSIHQTLSLTVYTKIYTRECKDLEINTLAI